MTEKIWQKLLIDCPAPLEDAIASFVTEQSGCGTEITEDSTAPGQSTVIGYLATEDPALADKLAAIRNYLSELARQFPEYKKTSLQTESLADQDWHQKWKESFKPFHLSRTIVIKPSWESYSPAEGEKVIEIDPGMAFGTGLHASTRLAMELLESRIDEMGDTRPETVLDVGTGTGILSIGAALMGCPKITAIDNDPEAVTAARDNVFANRFTDEIEVSIINLEKLTGPYNLILANIIHNTLVEMAPALQSLLAENGILILAGILKGEQSANIQEIYNNLGLTLVEERSSGEWSALSFRKN